MAALGPGPFVLPAAPVLPFVRRNAARRDDGYGFTCAKDMVGDTNAIGGSASGRALASAGRYGRVANPWTSITARRARAILHG